MKNQKYRFGIVAGLVGVACLPSAALARDGWYVGGGVGPNFQDTETFNVDQGGSFDAGYADNVVYGINIGYAMPSGWRPEFAVDFRSNDIDSISSGGQTFTNTTGHQDANSYMANLWFDLPLGSREWRRLHPYVGGGIGMATVGVHDLSLTNLQSVISIDDNQTVLAYQLGGGLAYDIAPSWVLSADFRYLATDKADFKYSASFPGISGTVNGGYSAESLMVGIRYQFGRDAFR